MRKVLAGLIVFLLLAVVVRSAVSYPNYSGYVNDFAKILTSDFINKLNLKLSDFDKKTTNQIAVVTVKTTEPETIEDYSIHLADKWKPGLKGKDNGVLILFAINDRHMRIEVGRGLEGDLTDLQSRQILDNIIRPYFRQNDYQSGIDKGVDAVIATISHQPLTSSATAKPMAPINIFITIIIVLIIIFFVAYSPYTPLGGQGIWGINGIWKPGSGDNDGGGTSFGGGSFSGGGSSSSW